MDVTSATFIKLKPGGTLEVYEVRTVFGFKETKCFCEDVCK